MSGEVARGFAAFAARRGSTRARSWWGRSWGQALEDTSLDLGQLKKGRRLANSGQVGTITVSPGRIAATVHAPEATYESVVVVDRLSPDEWTRFLDQVGSRAGHIAALLDGEMPHDLIEAAADAAVPLLPGIGDLDPSCTCDGWELPCLHAAALCYQVGWLLDEDPFVLLLIRGRSREQLLDDLQQRATGTPLPEATPAPAGVPASEVFEGGAPAELPELPALPAKAELDGLVVAGLQAPAGMEPASLPLLALDAARRARAQLSAILSGSPHPWALDEWQDAVRLAADYPVLADRLGTAFEGPAELAIGITAWTYGGAPGLDVLEHEWQPDPSELARARAELAAAWDDRDLVFEVSANRLSTADRQLRLDRIGRWHPYALVDDTWQPAGPADRDPTTALASPDNW
ncbi:SWIM zinc finger protein [Kribbella voronezhensis]|uniref:SWIM zinc finger protein n=1 Tax=Kribbella voronezhensis TaxID=2512212 RepID=A0A4R7SZ79_9ACTN|nr:SWIM zinc finger family protein [Kribbella voronezhensis]TDU84219.1 SWIM zinc finger protein [Kribbella voronezhensis]